MVCINWLWHSFAFSTEREINCMSGLGKLLLSNGNVRCVDQKFTENGKVAELCKTKNLFKNLLNFDKLPKKSFVEFYVSWRNCKIWLVHGIINCMIHQNNKMWFVASGLWQELELASELISDLQNTVEWGRKWLVDFNAWKTQLVSFDRSKNTGSIDLKIDGSALEEK